MSVAAPTAGCFWSGPIEYRLPSELIAQHPASTRAASRLMVVDRARGTLEHRRFAAIVEYLRPGDLLVLNDSRVIPARLSGRRRSGGHVEVLVLATDRQPAPAMIRSSKKLSDGEVVELEKGYRAVVRGPVEAGRCHLDFGPIAVETVLRAIGQIPLPPYIRRDGSPTPTDRERYQTVYATRDGSVAAPTAGLHFTAVLLSRLENLDVDVAPLTLHVGPGTFAPIRGDVASHRMESEHCEVSAALVNRANEARARGGRVVAVGTTTVRALETAAFGGALRPYRGQTDVFLRPGHAFEAVDGLVTNFHLPGSTLLCLVMAFAGESLIRRAYETAVAERYRFYSFGDAMLIL